MKYYTPDLYLRLQDCSSDEVMDKADAAWEQAGALYRRRLRRIRSALPQALLHLLENFYLHDANVLSMGQQDHDFVIVLQLDVPPQELLTLRYRLTEEPFINKTALPLEYRSRAPQWMHDGVGLVRGKRPHATHAILFSNGWEVQLCLSNVQVMQAQPVYPSPGTVLVPVSGSVVPQSA